MKRRIVMGVLLFALLAANVVGGVVYGRYVRAKNGEHTIKGAVFALECDRLTKDCPTYSVGGSGNAFTVANGMTDADASNVDIVYDVVRYGYDTETGKYVKVDSACLEDECLTATGSRVTKTYPVRPLTDGDKVYRKVKIVLTCKSFTTDELSAEYEFRYRPYSVQYAYDEASHVVSLLLATNGDGGDYAIRWSEGVMPYTSDPNDLIASAVESDHEIVCEGLESYTNYEKIYFVIRGETWQTLLAEAATQEEIQTILYSCVVIVHS